MTDYTELVKALRLCGDSGNIIDECCLADCMMLKDGEDERPSNCIDHIMSQAADAIEELTRRLEQALYTPPPRWISVKERLPEAWKPVQVTYLGFNTHKPRADMVAYIDDDDGCWHWHDEGTKCIVIITHWMPLQEPPKEETY